MLGSSTDTGRNLTTGVTERAFPGGAQAVQAVAYSADGARVAAGFADKSAIVWTAADGKPG